MATAAAYLRALRQAQAPHADPANAAAQQAYMKSALPFLGLKTPLRRRLAAEVAQQHPCADVDELAQAMRHVWRSARVREERYAAIELARQKPYRRWAVWALLPVYEEMIREGA